MIRLLALLLCLHAGPVSAGAWPREAGTGFASISHWQASDGAGNYTAVFAEWGVRPRLTLGLDAGRSVSGETKTVVFLRMPLMQWAGGPVAAEFGFGEIAGRAVVRPGLSYGRAFQLADWAGWVAIDTVLELDLDTRDMDLKADITFGVTQRSTPQTPPRWTLMLQVQTGLVSVEDSLIQLRDTGVKLDPSFLRIVPSATYRLRDGIDLEIGVYRSLTGSGEQGVKLGLWSRF